MALPYDQLENLVCIRSYKILYDLMSDFSTWVHLINANDQQTILVSKQKPTPEYKKRLFIFHVEFLKHLLFVMPKKKKKVIH